MKMQLRFLTAVSVVLSYAITSCCQVDDIVNRIIKTDAWEWLSVERICVRGRGKVLGNEVAKVVKSSTRGCADSSGDRAYDLISRGLMCQASKCLSLIIAYELALLNFNNYIIDSTKQYSQVYSRSNELIASIAIDLVRLLDAIIVWVIDRFRVQTDVFHWARDLLVESLKKYSKYKFIQLLLDLQIDFTVFVSKNCPCTRLTSSTKLGQKYTTVTSQEIAAIFNHKLHYNPPDFHELTDTKNYLVETALNRFGSIPDSWNLLRLKWNNRDKLVG